MSQFQAMDMTVAANLQLDAPLRKDSLLVFYRTISALLASGQTSAESFRLAGEYSPDPNMKAAALGVYDELARRGKSLREAIAKYPNMFSDLNKGLIATGEQIGGLDKIFLRIADAEEALDLTRKKITLALTYPSLILIGSLLVMVISPRFFVGHIRAFVADLDMTMPAFSRAVFALSDYLASPLLWTVVVGVLAALRLRWELLFRSDRIKARFFRLCYRLPPVTMVVRALTQAHWARVVSLQLDAGCKITEALLNIKQSLQDPVFKEACQTVIDALEKQGCTLAQAMQQSGYFDPLVVGMVAIGDETGKTPELLDFIARSYEEEFSLRLEMFEQLISPALMALVGLIVGVWTVAILLPLGQLISLLS
jgi:type II secretory pathway component PulF